MKTKKLALNSTGVFLKPLVTCFRNKVSKKVSENNDVANYFELIVQFMISMNLTIFFNITRQNKLLLISNR